MNNYWAFVPMRSSNDLLGDADALRDRFADDGYLYFREVLDADRITALRRRILKVLADRGWVKDVPLLMKGVAAIPPVREGDEEYLECYDEVQKLEEFHTLAHDPQLLAIMQHVVGPTAFPHPLKIARLAFPANYEVSTPPHQDYPNNQGTPNLTAAWVPVGACPVELGGLAVLRGSHKYGVLPLDISLGAGNRQARVPPDMLEKLRWVTTDYALGDVLLFGAMTVHASLHNASEFFMRISVDFRYQQEGEALTPICLEPHFERLSWDDVYADWSSRDHQYYWKDLDFETVPFETLPLADHSGELSVSEMQEFVAFERRRDARFERRMVQLATILDPDGPPLDSGDSSTN
jgi:ectoine hydroxylase-related dioxygenase (phytanoyl-CoA dioxygenase family)